MGGNHTAMEEQPPFPQGVPAASCQELLPLKAKEQVSNTEAPMKAADSANVSDKTRYSPPNEEQNSIDEGEHLGIDRQNLLPVMQPLPEKDIWAL
jgi:hypothetical protein